ncbi:phage tail protein [Kordia sp. YSTF-M3]|uniref:Phage tail protein n=1 Tax=Kordia aestuariivivens TaxID=2759037 RepID=A0ABR7QFL5_9FLAO|nr:tail fiber protein [Kordia aestuariivivens]MBC8757365.1 phage tail protein [Kordia aestuariivivens]
MDPFIGQIVMFGGNFAPRAWAFCDGQLLAISQNTALFSILGTTYGGDGRTTFALPDLRGRAAIHPGTGPGLSTIKLGQRGGAEYHTLTVSQMPNHAHSGATMKGSISVNEEDGVEDDPAGRNLGVSSAGTPYNTNTNDKLMAPNSVSISGNTLATGGNQSFYMRNPFEGINYIIALFGTFPSRN